MFVHGLSGTCKDGREADIDETHGVIPIVCVGRKRHTTNYSDCTVVHPAVGTTMTRDKDDMPAKRRRTVAMCTQRPKIRRAILLLQERWRAARCQADGATCEICCESAIGDDNPLCHCWLCNMSAHTGCAKGLLSIAVPKGHTIEECPALAFDAPFDKSVA